MDFVSDIRWLTFNFLNIHMQYTCYSMCYKLAFEIKYSAEAYVLSITERDGL